MRKSFYLALILSLISSSVEVIGQVRRPQLTSPVINADKTVTFSFFAPEARKVELSAQFVKGLQPMFKDTEGVWRITLGPVEPDIYPYCFVADGIQVADPNNVLIFPNERFKNSLVDIPGDSPLIHAMQNVSHGKVSYRLYNSNSLDLVRPLVIYTPPGYDKNKNEKYPVLYLIHGMTDTEETWFKVGRVNLILDNLIAQGKAKPMIIVMPYANPYPALAAKSKNIQGDVMNTDFFSNDMLSDVIPFIETNYRTLRGSENRAVAGFSLGGRQALAVGLVHPELFSWVCAFAPAIFSNDFKKTILDSYVSPDLLNKQLKLLWVSCGNEDSLYNSSVGFIEGLKSNNIKHRTFLTGGGHTWMNCRLYIAETAQLLFK